jgi:hypothetical protein
LTSPRQDALQLTIEAALRRNQAHCALGQPLGRAHI